MPFVENCHHTRDPSALQEIDPEVLEEARKRTKCQEFEYGSSESDQGKLCNQKKWKNMKKHSKIFWLSSPKWLGCHCEVSAKNQSLDKRMIARTLLKWYVLRQIPMSACSSFFIRIKRPKLKIAGKQYLCSCFYQWINASKVHLLEKISEPASAIKQLVKKHFGITEMLILHWAAA